MKKTIITAALAAAFAATAFAAGDEPYAKVDIKSDFDKERGTFSTKNSAGKSTFTLVAVFDWKTLSATDADGGYQNLTTTYTSAVWLDSSAANSKVLKALSFKVGDDGAITVGAQKQSGGDEENPILSTLSDSGTVSSAYAPADILVLTFTMDGTNTIVSAYDPTGDGFMTELVNVAEATGQTLNELGGDADLGLKAVYVYDHNLTDSTTVTLTDAAKTAYQAQVVPEPATATLSLLALAGLAARRRRK